MYIYYINIIYIDIFNIYVYEMPLHICITKVSFDQIVKHSITMTLEMVTSIMLVLTIK